MKYLAKFILIPLFALLCLATSCKKKNQSSDLADSDKKEVVKSKFAKNYPEFNPTDFSKILWEDVQHDSLLSVVYNKIDRKPVWLHDTLDTQSLYGFLDILNSTEIHGLPSTTFEEPVIRSLTDSIDSGVYKSNIDTLYYKVNLVEQLATKAALKYITGMRYGFVCPKKLYPDNYDITIAKPDSAYYSNLYKELKENPLKAILDAQPTDSIYLKLQEEYKRYTALEDTLSSAKIKSGNATYKLGDKSKHIKEIAERLIITGEYTPKDSIHDTLDEHLLEAINTFRKKISYIEEKEVGKATVDALNRPASYYKRLLQANMERYRWRRIKTKYKKHIEVNVAAAMLAATQQENEPLIMRVCVGKAINKTPLLESNIGYLNLNPYWNVPKSIAQNEVAVLQKRDSTYIRRHNMKLYKGGKEVPVSSIEWGKVNPASFSYIVRQEPGYGNSLGLIKFMFENRHSVYLHDTPSKMAFTRKNRAVSHGCVRVQKPFDLAYFCLAPTTEVYRDQLLYTAKMNPVSTAGKKLLKENKLKKLSDIINLKEDNKISLFIDYYTAYTFPEDGIIYYADDVYSYDDLILNELSIISI